LAILRALGEIRPGPVCINCSNQNMNFDYPRQAPLISLADLTGDAIRAEGIADDVGFCAIQGPVNRHQVLSVDHGKLLFMLVKITLPLAGDQECSLGSSAPVVASIFCSLPLDRKIIHEPHSQTTIPSRPPASAPIISNKVNPIKLPTMPPITPQKGM